MKPREARPDRSVFCAVLAFGKTTTETSRQVGRSSPFHGHHKIIWHIGNSGWLLLLPDRPRTRQVEVAIALGSIGSEHVTWRGKPRYGTLSRVLLARRCRWWGFSFRALLDFFFLLRFRCGIGSAAGTVESKCNESQERTQHYLPCFHFLPLLLLSTY